MSNVAKTFTDQENADNKRLTEEITIMLGENKTIGDVYDALVYAMSWTTARVAIQVAMKCGMMAQQMAILESIDELTKNKE